MTLQRMDHVGVVVDDLDAATAFFVELGFTRQGGGTVDGDRVDRIVGLEGVRSEFAMIETPDGHGRLELTKFHAPPGPGGDRHAPANTPGIRHLTFAVDDIDTVLARLRAHGAELVGGIESYGGSYRLCYVRGHLHELSGDLPAAATAYAEAARRATDVAERDHLVRQAARARAAELPSSA